MDVSPGDAGTVQVNEEVLTSYPATLTFNSGESVSIKAIPGSDYEFIVWEGSLSGSDNPATITMSCPKKITANFYQPLYTLTIESNGNGTTTPLAGTYSHYKGTEVSITAIPDDGWQFDSWTGDAVESEPATAIITMDSNKNIVANFSQIIHTLTIEVNGSGSTNPVAGQYSYPNGTEISIIATPDDDWQFDGWSGDMVGSEFTETVLTMDSDKTVIANFSIMEIIEADQTRGGFTWWLIGGTAAGVIVIGVGIRFFRKRRVA